MTFVKVLYMNLYFTGLISLNFNEFYSSFLNISKHIQAITLGAPFSGSSVPHELTDLGTMDLLSALTRSHSVRSWTAFVTPSRSSLGAKVGKPLGRVPEIIYQHIPLISGSYHGCIGHWFHHISPTLSSSSPRSCLIRNCHNI